MINPNLLTNELAEKMAKQILVHNIKKEFVGILEHSKSTLSKKLLQMIKEALKEDDKKLAHDILFNALFKAISPYEKKFEAMLKGIWDEERRILVANLKKMKKAWLHKDKIDDVMYPTAVFEKKLANGVSTILVEVMSKEGPRVVSLYDFDMIFDVNDPKVQEWLKSYTPMFSKKLEEVNVKKLRAQLIEGMNAGEGIPELTRRVYETYDDWGFRRAKTISRTEALRASNQASLNVYRQSGVVKKKIWITHFSKLTCVHCESMDGKVIELEANFWDLGDESTIKVDGKDNTLKFDYEEIAAPPAHPRCYDKETEIYTNKGWQYFSNLMGDEKCLSLNPDSFDLAYQPIMQKIAYHYTGDMIHFYNRSFDLKVTPNHQMFYKKRWDQRMGREDKYQFCRADQLPPESWIYRSSKWKGQKKEYIEIGDLKIRTDIYCRLMGYYLSEGTVSQRTKRGFQIAIAQTNLINKQIMYHGIKNLPINVSNGKDKLYIFNFDLGKYLQKFGKSSEKYIPQEIKELSPEQIEIFLDAFCLGDGHIKKGRDWKGGNFKNARVFTTSSKRLADDIGELLLKIGKRPSFRLDKKKGMQHVFRNGTYTLNHDIWIISECHRQAAHESGLSKDKIVYNDMVYCVELPEWHTLWIRRNGKTAWCGNCRCTVSAYIED